MSDIFSRYLLGDSEAWASERFMLVFQISLFYSFIMVAQVGWVRIVIREKFHPEWKSHWKFLQTSGNFLYSCFICVIVKCGSLTQDANAEGTWPLSSWTLPPRLLGSSFLYSKKSLTLLHFFFYQLHQKSWTQLMIFSCFIPAHGYTFPNDPSWTGPKDHFCFIPFGARLLQSSSFSAKMCLLDFFFVHFLFPFHLKLEENNSTCLCYRPSSSLPPFALPYFKNHQ